MTIQERLEANSQSISEGCRLWTGYRNAAGYGHISVAGETRLAHRVAYELRYGPIPTGLVLDHLCRNKPCIETDHLEAVEQRINVYRGRSGAIPLFCKRGHYRTAGTLYRSSSGGLGCYPCQLIHASNHRIKRRLAAA